MDLTFTNWLKGQLLHNVSTKDLKSFQQQLFEESPKVIKWMVCGGENSFPTYLYRNSSELQIQFLSIKRTGCRIIFSAETYLSLLPESPLELLLGRAGGGDVDGKEELLEVNVAVLVGVERAEHVVAELLGVAAGEEQLVHVDKLGRGQTAVGAVLLEALVPLLDRVLVVARVRLEELEVLLAKARLALYAPHVSVLGFSNGVKTTTCQ